MDEFNNYTIEDFQTKETAIAQTLDALGAQLEENSDDLYKMGQEYYQAWVELRKTKIEKVKSAYAQLAAAKNALREQAKKDKEVLKLQERYTQARNSPQTQNDIFSLESLNQLKHELDQKEQEVFNQLQTKYATKIQTLEKDATKAQQEFDKEMKAALNAKGSKFETLKASAKKLGEERRALQKSAAKEKQSLAELQTAMRDQGITSQSKGLIKKIATLQETRSREEKQTAETRERARLQKQVRQNTQKQSASTATKTVKKKPEWVRTLYTPSEIMAGKVPKGKTVHVPMKLVTANGQHYNEYTGISEEELVKKYHFPPDQAKKMAKQYSVEEYQKLDKVMVKPLKESATVSKMAKVPVGGKTTYNGPQDAGSKGTAYHTVAEMVFGDESWTVEDILREFAKKAKGVKSRLTDKQYGDLSGLNDIYNTLGIKTQGKKAQTTAATQIGRAHV